MVNWEVQLENSDNCSFKIGDEIILESTKEQLKVTRQIFNPKNYSIISSNSNNLIDTNTYFIKVIEDEFPTINLTQSLDTLNKKYLFSGIIEDDYLLNKLEFICSYNLNDSDITSVEDISIAQKNLEQFFYSTKFEELDIKPGEEATYFFKVWDNDGVNGSKFTTSRTFVYKEMSTDELLEKRDIQNKKTKRGLNKSISLAENIQKKIAALNKTLL
jgi:uncharacterized protein (DUF2344 family)